MGERTCSLRVGGGLVIPECIIGLMGLVAGPTAGLWMGERMGSPGLVGRMGLGVLRRGERGGCWMG